MSDPFYTAPRTQRPFYTLITPPTTEPISVEQASAHLRVDSEDDLTYIEALIGVAREYVDNVTGRVAMHSHHRVSANSWVGLTGPEFLDTVNLYRSPLTSVTHVKYYPSGSNVLTTIPSTDYRVITGSLPGMVQFVIDLPTVEDRVDAIQITFTAGQTVMSAVTPGQRHAVQLLTAHLYENRVPVVIGNITAELPYSLKALIEQQKIGGWFV
jgi:uncharacterized phiE125 gp8 family phage protein